MQMDSLPSDLRDGVNSQLFWSKWVIKLWPIGSLLLFASGSWLLLDGLKKWTQVSKSIDALEDRDRELKNKKLAKEMEKLSPEEKQEKLTQEAKEAEEADARTLGEHISNKATKEKTKAPPSVESRSSAQVLAARMNQIAQTEEILAEGLSKGLQNSFTVHNDVAIKLGRRLRFTTDFLLVPSADLSLPTTAVEVKHVGSRFDPTVIDRVFSMASRAAIDSSDRDNGGEPGDSVPFILVAVTQLSKRDQLEREFTRLKDWIVRYQHDYAIEMSAILIPQHVIEMDAGGFISTAVMNCVLSPGRIVGMF